MASFEEIEEQREVVAQQAARERQRIAAAEQLRQQKIQQAERLRDKLLAITYSELSATPAEIEKINRLVKEHFPERFGDPATHRVKLLIIRSLTESAKNTGGSL